VIVKEVKALELAELNAELFASYGVEDDDVEAFRTEVRKNMERELKAAVDGHVKQQVMDAIVEAHPWTRNTEQSYFSRDGCTSRSNVPAIWRCRKSRYGSEEYSP
jgi:hypothetical protein